MGIVDAFVSEGTTNLEYPVLASNDQPLEIQLRSDSEPDGHVRELVRNGLKWPRDSTASIDIEERSFNFQKPALYEVCPYVIIDQRAEPEDVARFVARERVDVRPTSQRLRVINLLREVV